MSLFDATEDDLIPRPPPKPTRIQQLIVKAEVPDISLVLNNHYPETTSKPCEPPMKNNPQVIDPRFFLLNGNNHETANFREPKGFNRQWPEENKFYFREQLKYSSDFIKGSKVDERQNWMYRNRNCLNCLHSCSMESNSNKKLQSPALDFRHRDECCNQPVENGNIYQSSSGRDYFYKSHKSLEKIVEKHEQQLKGLRFKHQDEHVKAVIEELDDRVTRENLKMKESFVSVLDFQNMVAKYEERIRKLETRVNQMTADLEKAKIDKGREMLPQITATQYPHDNFSVENKMEEKEINHGALEMCERGKHFDSDISLHMNALATKYIEGNGSIGRNYDKASSNISVSTLQYFERHHLTSHSDHGNGNHHPEHAVIHRNNNNMESVHFSPRGKILDITAIRKQPKLM